MLPLIRAAGSWNRATRTRVISNVATITTTTTVLRIVHRVQNANQVANVERCSCHCLSLFSRRCAQKT